MSSSISMLHSYEDFDNEGQAIQAFYASVYWLMQEGEWNINWIFNFVRYLYIDYISPCHDEVPFTFDVKGDEVG